MLTGIRHFAQDELRQLAEKIPDADIDERMTFLHTIVENTNYHRIDGKGRVWVKLDGGTSDRKWVEELAASSGFTLSKYSTTV